MRALLAVALLLAPAAFAERREITLAEALSLAQKNSHDPSSFSCRVPADTPAGSLDVRSVRPVPSPFIT